MGLRTPHDRDATHLARGAERERAGREGEEWGPSGFKVFFFCFFVRLCLVFGLGVWHFDLLFFSLNGFYFFESFGGIICFMFLGFWLRQIQEFLGTGFLEEEGLLLVVFLSVGLFC